MKVSRIYPYNKTKEERRHECEIATARKHGFKHPGSKPSKILHCIVKNTLYNERILRSIKDIFK